MLGVVSIVDWPIEQIMRPQYIWYLGQLVAIQDCLYKYGLAQISNTET